MIKQINVSNMQKFESQLMKAQSEGYTHAVPYANEIMIYQSMLDAVQLYPKSIVVDYTVDGQYKMIVTISVNHRSTLPIGLKTIIIILT